MSDAKVMLMILRMMDGIVDGRKLFEEGDKLLVGYSKDFAGAGKKTVINFCGQSGNGITILNVGGRWDPGFSPGLFFCWLSLGVLA